MILVVNVLEWIAVILISLNALISALLLSSMIHLASQEGRASRVPIAKASIDIAFSLVAIVLVVAGVTVLALLLSAVSLLVRQGALPMMLKDVRPGGSTP